MAAPVNGNTASDLMNCFLFIVAKDESPANICNIPFMFTKEMAGVLTKKDFYRDKTIRHLLYFSRKLTANAGGK
jgi:hypothetical protein